MLALTIDEFLYESQKIEPFTVSNLALYMGLSAGLGLALAWHFIRFGSTFGNRAKLGAVLPVIAMTTALIMGLIRANFALSLGLVGALSIVRFRTPIKEPEELAYLFVSIAVGLGMGAHQPWITALGVLAILLLLTVRALVVRGGDRANLYLNLEIPHGADRSNLLKEMLGVLSPHVRSVDLRRFDVQPESVQATFYIDCRDTDRLAAMGEALRKQYPAASISFVDPSGAPVG